VVEVSAKPIPKIIEARARTEGLFVYVKSMKGGKRRMSLGRFSDTDPTISGRPSEELGHIGRRYG